MEEDNEKEEQKKEPVGNCDVCNIPIYWFPWINGVPVRRCGTHAY